MASTALKTFKRYRGSRAVESAETWYERLRFEGDRRRRRAHIGSSVAAPAVRHPCVDDLERDGVAVLPKAVTATVLEEVRVQFDRELDAGEHLNPASDDADRPMGDIDEPTRFLDDALLRQGERACRVRTNYLSVRDPLLHCPATVPLAFDEQWIDIAWSYLACPPMVGGLNLRKSFVNDLPDFDTLYFHSDKNSPRFLKFFFYLQDVDAEGGPFCYVRGSHRDKFRGWRRKYRWTPDEIEAEYGTDRIFLATAEAGDVVIADTTGFHRGTKVRSRDRSMLTVDYVVHPEFRGRAPRPVAATASIGALTVRQRAAADLVDVRSSSNG